MKHILALVVVGALSGTLWAADPWKSNEKYTEWSEKEIRKVIRKSPWAKTVTLTVYSGLGPAGGGDQGGYSGPPAAGGAPRGTLGTGLAGADSGRRSIRVLLRWQTALPVRQAYARQQQESDKMKREEAERLLQQTPPEYRVLLTDMPKTAMAGVPVDKVKADTYLKIGKKSRIMAREVVTEVVTSKGDALDVVFIFPRTTAIELQHKKVEFVTKIGQHKIKKKFSLKKMVYQGKLEL